MCGIAGQISLRNESIPDLKWKLTAMSNLIAHRGPDGEGFWQTDDNRVGLVHRRLSVIDLSDSASQPMTGNNGSVISFNGEIYNYPELQNKLKGDWQFKSRSDTECILAAYQKYGTSCLDHLRGMFAFAIWDDKTKKLFCARDRFGIKPLYYCQVGDVLYFASEAKALVPFLDRVDTDKAALAEYLTFQYTIGEKTLFSGIHQLMPGHAMSVQGGRIEIWRYWDVSYDIDFDHSAAYFHQQLKDLMLDSIELHGRSDVSVGAYVSGGIDSSLVYQLAQRNQSSSPHAFNGRFRDYEGFDESNYALAAVEKAGGQLNCVDITADDFKNNIEKVIYHLDFPVAGPGAFSQYMVSELASQYVKVVLGGQGGDELFGGYARYVIAYFEQCIKAAIDGQYKSGNYVVTIESIIPNLGLLREYKPLMKEFWREGLFSPMDERYFRLVNRATDMQDEIDWSQLDMDGVFARFQGIFNNSDNVQKEAYFDKMTHFDFKCLLPALLHVEDRMSMAHGIESRVPLLDHPLVEFAATVPADIKFQGGNMKHLIKQVFSADLHPDILNRRDKMGFPVPLKQWFDGDLKEFVSDTFNSMASKHRDAINANAALKNIAGSGQFSRKSWALLSLELWYQQFHDTAPDWKQYI